ncbi:MAG: Transcriptional regulator, MarR family [uncultured Frankineae bacterium]|uniref:Transcriptional regulator, MarR family n=1 Tax=uncultured Frankineae bacterium TaxID=437475 RepID=A0A6J4M9Z9_9ACTN|nr:MAG: Transcriptional regulator, MarR family [uncultured Frankineae bacterium]
MTSSAQLGPPELSARLGISSGSGTELVDRLEQAGQLVRQRDTEDRRRVLLQMTPRCPSPP